MKYIVAFCLSIQTMFSFAETPPPAYQRAALFGGVPPEVLYAIAKMESNYKIKIGTYPWPWTLNIKGKGYYYATRQEACAAALDGISRHGKYGVDIGLTQQNWGWVGIDYYANPCDALSPNENLRTAARQLNKCFQKEGDWVRAAGCYHRPAGGEPARIYREKFNLKYTKLLSGN